METFLRARRNRQKQQQQKREEGIEIEFDKKLISHTSERFPVLILLLPLLVGNDDAQYYLIGMKLQVPLPLSPTVTEWASEQVG